ncbi:unnamed protein product [Ectocarpus sp. 13 AM-2016]
MTELESSRDRHIERHKRIPGMKTHRSRPKRRRAVGMLPGRCRSTSMTFSRRSRKDTTEGMMCPLLFQNQATSRTQLSRREKNYPPTENQSPPNH